jgi:hypothetical protein
VSLIVAASIIVSWSSDALTFHQLSFPSLSLKARRISAISIAERVAQEQCLPKGKTDTGVGSLVGYQVRLEAAASKDTQLLFVTPGILLRRLQSSPLLSEFTHIILDEVHERDRYTDFLLVQLKNVLLPQRPDLRLILMSATLQTELLIQYFAADDHPFYKENPPSVIAIEGRTFPVQEFFLEHVLEMTGYIDPAVANAVSGGASGNVMSMDELDAELAKLMGEESIRQPDEVAVLCPMCQEFFPNPVELGAHVALCQGRSIDDADDSIINHDDTLLEGSAQGSSTSQLTTTNSMQLNGFEAFEAYDEDETAKVGGYSLPFPGVTTPRLAPNVEAEVTSNKKWDGNGEFMVDAVPTSDVTPNQDALLHHYQSMHDDEKVDTDLLLDALRYICESSKDDGAVLVFLPGWQEISEFSLLLESTQPFQNYSKFLVLPLHSGIPSKEQRLVLQRPPPGKRKIVLSTNISETSL